jgi:2,5-diketo-D-gluconate reductase A
MTTSPDVRLDDGRDMPALGFGTFQIPNEEVGAALAEALDTGYRLIDTASLYHNEEGVGEAISGAPVPRDRLFVTTKVWHDRHGFDETLRALDESLGRLGLDYVDLYLIHWPVPRLDRYVDTWRAMVRLREEGMVRSIGVSNFNPRHVERIVQATDVAPAVNQIELHPSFQQRRLREFHEEVGIVTQSWAPIAKGRLLDDETIVAIAEKHGKTPAQVILRWHLDSGLTTIPKSVSPTRIRENFDVFDFRLDAQDMERVDRLDHAGGRIGFDPDTFG